MSDKFTNNVRSRLYKQGYQGFTKSDFTDAVTAIGLEDLENPTKEQLAQAVDFLIDKQSKQLAVADDSDVEILPELTDDIKDESDSGETAALAVSDRQEIIKQQSYEMGVTLSEQDVIAIAQNSDDQVADGIDFLVEAKNLISDYLDKQVNSYQQQSEALLGDISQKVSDAQTQISQIDESSNTQLANILGGVAEVAQRRKSLRQSRIAGLRTALNASD